MTRLAPSIMIAGAVALPFVAAWPMLQPNGIAAAPGLEAWAARVLWATIFLAIGAFVAMKHVGLGLAVALGAAEMIRLPMFLMQQTTGAMLALGALAVVWIGAWNATTRRHALTALGATGALESLVMLAQRAGFNPLWSGWARTSESEMKGTLGNGAFAACFVALTALALPWQALPAIGLILWMTQVKSAILAFALGCAVRFAPSTKWMLVSGLLAAALIVLGLSWSVSGQAREWIWRESLRLWFAQAPWFGYGLGLAPNVPTPQGSGAAYDVLAWQHPHNEAIQWIRERGLLGLPALGLMLWSLARSCRHHLAGASVAALLVIGCTQNALHVVAVAVAAVVIVGVALTPTSELRGA